MLRVAGITTRIVVQLSFQPRFKAPAWRVQRLATSALRRVRTY